MCLFAIWTTGDTTDCYVDALIVLMVLIAKSSVRFAMQCNSSSGIQGRIAELSALLHRHDPELHQYLQAQQLEPSYYALRWITTLLSREFNLPDTIRVWDSLFSDTNRWVEELRSQFCSQ